MKTCAYKKYLYMDVYSRGCNNPKLKQYIRAMESNPGLLHCGQTLVPGGSDGKASARNAGDNGFDSWVRKIPWRRKWQSTPTLLPGKSQGRRSLIGYSPWGCKKSDTTERLNFHFIYTSIKKKPLV